MKLSAASSYYDFNSESDALETMQVPTAKYFLVLVFILCGEQTIGSCDMDNIIKSSLLLYEILYISTIVPTL